MRTEGVGVTSDANMRRRIRLRRLLSVRGERGGRMTAAEPSAATSAAPEALAPSVLADVNLDERTRAILERRRGVARLRRRGWVIRRMLIAADVAGLSFGFIVAEALRHPGSDRVDLWAEALLFTLSLPLWILAAKLFGLYDRDEERTEHSTADELVRVFLLVTVATWIFTRLVLVSYLGAVEPLKLTIFWGFAISMMAAARVLARAISRRHISYFQNTVVVGAGEVGQLIARKYLQHAEYGINLVGFVDARPKERREELGHLALLGPPERLPEIVAALDVERVVFAFSNDSDEDTLSLIRDVRALNVQVDVVPRLFDVVGPTATFHAVEGVPLVSLPPLRISRSFRLLKRTIDVAVASLAIGALAPLFLLIAWRIKRDSPGPVFFRQMRLGMNMCQFTILKFRTMRVDAEDAPHREYIKSTMSSKASPTSGGLYKLARDDVVTPSGRFLRRASLDELPQLFNVLRGDMSLVGPRPCLAYETEHFAPHHFDRFLVPAGMTGLWQVTARAHSTFVEALDMDVAYARNRSLGLDLRILLRTPIQIFRPKGTA